MTGDLLTDAIDLIPGKATFSLWALLKSVVVVTGFVVITSLIARYTGAVA